MTEAEIKAQLQKYSFYHVIELTPNLQTPGVERYTLYHKIPLEALRRLDLRGKRLLDIGCRDGLFCFEAERLGAAEVIGIDNDLSPAAVEFLIPFFASRVKMYERNILDLSPADYGQFDVVLLLGVLYHLRYPFWSLQKVRAVLREGGSLILETVILRDDDQWPLLLCPIGDEGPHREATSCTFFNLKGLRDTLATFGLNVRAVEIWETERGHYPRLRRLKDLVRDVLGLKRIMRTARATLVCVKTPDSISEDLDAYWHRTHRTHTHMYLADKPKRFEWQGA